jgi:hypothetical protein
MTPGQEVKVRAYGGRVLQRIVIKLLGDTVLICKPEEWEAARREGRAANGVGFPVATIVATE